MELAVFQDSGIFVFRQEVTQSLLHCGILEIASTHTKLVSLWFLTNCPLGVDSSKQTAEAKAEQI